MWFSNWLVTAPSIVQWPELCTRGAISLNTGPCSRGEELERQHADVAERVGDLARQLARLGDLRRDDRGRRQRGAGEDAAFVDVLGESQKRISPSRPRTRITENSASKRTRPS